MNLSLSPEDYAKLQQATKEYKFKNLCELMVALAHIFIDRMEEAGRRKYDPPEDVGGYIDSMFKDLGNTHRLPDGTVPIRHKCRRLK